MTNKAYQTQKIFFALGTVCTLTVFGGDGIHAMTKAKARILEIDRKVGCLNPAVCMMSKGYATQEAGRILKQSGVSEALIVIGETVVNIGSKRRIGLQNPFGKAGDNFAYIDVEEKAVVSTGLYRQGFEQQSRADHRGENALAGLTLIGDNAVKLNALCNTASALSLSDAMALLNDTEVEAIFITRGQKVVTTNGLQKHAARQAA